MALVMVAGSSWLILMIATPVGSRVKYDLGSDGHLDPIERDCYSLWRLALNGTSDANDIHCLRDAGVRAGLVVAAVLGLTIALVATNTYQLLRLRGIVNRQHLE